MTDESPASGWLLTIPNRTLQFINLLPTIIEKADPGVMMTSRLTPKATSITGTGEMPLVLETFGLTVRDGVPPADHDDSWEPQVVWLFRGTAEEVKWPKTQ